MKIIVFIIVSLKIFVNKLSFEIKLIEQCLPPWREYRITSTVIGSNEGKKCLDRCSGKAFHTNEGKLICFNTKVYASPVPEKYIENYDQQMCYCGYALRKSLTNSDGNSSKRSYQEWMKCDPYKRTKFPRRRKLCKEECSETELYLHIRKKIKYLVYCEYNQIRNHFYSIVGEIGELLLVHSTDNLNKNKIINYNKYRKCKCGIDDTKLMKINSFKTTNAVEIFEVCDDPWVSKKMNVRTLNTCLKNCAIHCKKGKGIKYDSYRICFHRETPAVIKKRKVKLFPSYEKCECGHGKQTYISGKNHKEFVSCNPEIVLDIFDYRECLDICKQSRVYITKRKQETTNIRCVYKPNPTLLPQILSGKCEENVIPANEEGNSKYPHMICKCGLLVSPDGNKLVGNDNLKTEYNLKGTYKSEYLNISKDLSSWGIRKKRSIMLSNKKGN